MLQLILDGMQRRCFQKNMGIRIGRIISVASNASLNQRSFLLSKYLAVIIASGMSIKRSSLPSLVGEKNAETIPVMSAIRMRNMEDFWEIEALPIAFK